MKRTAIEGKETTLFDFGIECVAIQSNLPLKILLGAEIVSLIQSRADEFRLENRRQEWREKWEATSEEAREAQRRKWREREDRKRRGRRQLLEAIADRRRLAKAEDGERAAYATP